MNIQSALIKIKECVSEIKQWMSLNKLQLNEEKTEVMMFTPQTKHQIELTHIDLCEVSIPISNEAKNIGVTFDTVFSMDKQISQTCKTAMYHLRRISKIRQYITQSACEKLVHAFITSRLDYGNAILYGLPQYKLEKLQRIMNAAARIVSKTKKFHHVTPVLHQLHWLPIEERIDFKVLLLTFRAYH